MAEAQVVTSLAESPYEERRSRFIKYTIAMVIRVICIVLAVTVPVGLITFFFVAGAVFLPYFAVVIANAQGSSSAAKLSPVAKAPSLSISAEAFSEGETPKNG